MKTNGRILGIIDLSFLSVHRFLSTSPALFQHRLASLTIQFILPWLYRQKPPMVPASWASTLRLFFDGPHIKRIPAVSGIHMYTRDSTLYTWRLLGYQRHPGVCCAQYQPTNSQYQLHGLEPRSLCYVYRLSFLSCIDYRFARD